MISHKNSSNLMCWGSKIPLEGLVNKEGSINAHVSSQNSSSMVPVLQKSQV